MDFKDFLILLLGAALPLLGQYVLDSIKEKNERAKFSLEKIITVGEEFYRYSGLALLRFEATLSLIQNAPNYDNPKALQVFADVEANLIELSKTIASTTITISAANIYYRVSNIKTVSDAVSDISKAFADFCEIDALDNPINNAQRTESLMFLKGKIEELVEVISTDRKTIEIRIQKLMKIPAL